MNEPRQDWIRCSVCRRPMRPTRKIEHRDLSVMCWSCSDPEGSASFVEFRDRELSNGMDLVTGIFDKLLGVTREEGVEDEYADDDD